MTGNELPPQVHHRPPPPDDASPLLVWTPWHNAVTIGARKSRPIGLVAALALVLSAHPAAAQKPDTCIRYWDEVRYGALAFNHIVHIANGCAAIADCVVSTDVNPQPQEVEVGGHSELEVVTFIGSPARTFQSRVKCTMHLASG